MTSLSCNELKGRTVLVIAVFLLTAFAASCRTTTDDRKGLEQEPSGVIEDQFDEASSKKQAAAAMWEYAYTEKAEFVDKMKKELVTIQAELARLSSEAEGSRGAVEADAKVKLNAVHAKWAESKRQLDLAEDATESTWDDVQSGFNKRYGELKDSLDEARRWLSDSIEP